MARAAKLDLRAFQQELAARLAAKTTQQVEQSRLGLACADKQWLIRLADAGEVIAIPTMATVPLTRQGRRRVAGNRSGPAGAGPGLSSSGTVASAHSDGFTQA